MTLTTLSYRMSIVLQILSVTFCPSVFLQICRNVFG